MTDFNLLKPLIFETATRLKNTSPAVVQTGPASRKDVETIEKHLQILNEHPKLHKLYQAISDSIMQ